MSKRIHVVVGVIRHPQAESVLIAKRPEHAHQGGKWEFPGGKCEHDESPKVALARELLEELAIQLVAAEPLMTINHDYPDKSVCLDVWEVTAFTGEPIGNEGQPIAWVNSDALNQYAFPAANGPIISAVQLPKFYWITPSAEHLGYSLEELDRQLGDKLESGLRLLQLRLKTADLAFLKAGVVAAAQLCNQYQAKLLLNGSDWMRLRTHPEYQALESPLSGVHLTAQQLAEPDAVKEALSAIKQTGLLAASCHNLTEIQNAQQLGCHFVTLSPIKTTGSHPQRPPLAGHEVDRCLQQVHLPVFALGGLSRADLSDMRRRGFQGVAGISRF